MTESINVVFDEQCSANDILEKLPVGNLHIDQAHGKLVVAFEFADVWLATHSNVFLDPELFPYAGRQYPSTGRDFFGMLEDASPDRWGRTLIQREEARLARQEKRAPRTLTKADYLLRVSDESRMGALRYRRDDQEPYLADTGKSAIPPMKMLRELEHAARILDNPDESFPGDEELALLLAPGSSLGGARPKATVKDINDELWIAKFPSHNDYYDLGLAEMLVYIMAKECGLKTEKADCQQFSKAGHTFMVKRFDREGGKRIHFSSAMTLLGKQDGAGAQSGVSYLDIAEIIRERGACPQKDLRELFKRIVFSVAVSNTDDHLRNHGFLLRESGWELSPLYDVNPNPQGSALSLNISQFDNALSFELVAEQAEYFDLSTQEAQGYIDEIKQVVSSWKTRTKHLGMSSRDRDMLRAAWRVG